MSIEINYFDPRILTAIITKKELKYNTFSALFKEKAPSPSEIFDIQVRSRKTTMIPAVTNYSQASMRQQEGYEVQTIKAPRFRLKRAFQAADRFHLPFGSTPYDRLPNIMERELSDAMDRFNEEFAYAIEVMCCQAVVDGKLDLYDKVDDEVVKRFSVDFGRPSKHKVDLTTDADSAWNNPNANIRRQLDEWCDMIQEETGYAPDTLLLGRNAWDAFFAHNDVRDLFDNRRVDLGTLAPRINKTYKGMFFGLDVYTVPGKYTDLAGVTKRYLDDNKAILIAKDAPAIIEYAQPVDNKCPSPTKRFCKSYEQEDPSGTFLIAESRPLPWPLYPGWAVVADVIAPDSVMNPTGK